jgi:hypothetical protein
MQPGRPLSLGLFPVLMLVNACGLLCISYSYYISIERSSNLAVEVCFLLGLLVMFVPNLVRLLSPSPSRLERLCLLCSLGLAFYCVQFMVSPLHFSSFDDFLHWRTASDILRTGHLFSPNSMLPVSPFYPGLEIVTNAVMTMTGLSPFYAGVVVIVASRVLMIFALFLFCEQITGSSRMAGIATAVYMTNPHFLFFDVIFNYETLALPLATFMLYLLARYENAEQNYRHVVYTAWFVLAAITITHHMTNYVFDGLLLLWAVSNFFRPSSPHSRVHLLSIALFGITLSLAYAFLLPGNPAWLYLSSYFGSTFTELGQIIAGTSTARALFTNSVQPVPIWDRLFLASSVAIIAFCLPFGLLSLWYHHRHNALAVAFGLASLAYPITQVFRFTVFGAEITDRSAAFLFLPIAYILTVLITHFWPTRKLTWNATALIICAFTIVFLGGVIAQAGPGYSNLPGPYMVGADFRSIEPENIQDARWSLLYLGANNRIATDRTNQMLLNSYGYQRIVTHLADNVDISPIFYSMTFTANDISIISTTRIRYLVVDLRLSTSLPLEGFYFEDDHPITPLQRQALTKFNGVPQLDRLFDSGNIVIYDTGAFDSQSGY